MSQKDVWEKEYKNPQLLKLGNEPRADLKKYIKFLKKTEKVVLDKLNILDLGSGTGQNTNYLADIGDNTVIGIEISPKALEIARFRAKEMNVIVDYKLANIGEIYPFKNESFDLVIDIMSSNSLNEKEREIYLNEVHRVLKSSGHFFVRTLCKDGDKNTKNLLKENPGKEYDTYVNKDMGLVERVFSEKDFTEMYSKYFEIQSLIKKTNYAQFKGQNYKRNYWLGYLKKK